MNKDSSCPDEMYYGNTSDPASSSADDLAFTGEITLGECSIAPVLMDGYNDTTKPFEYKLKDSYSSRQQVLEEMYTLDQCHRRYLDYTAQNDSYEFEDISHDTFIDLAITLQSELSKFPPSEYEKKQNRINEFYAYHETSKTVYETFKAKMDGNFEYETNKKYYNMYKAEYDKEEIVRKDYEAGKITIEEALIRIGLPQYTNGTISGF